MDCNASSFSSFVVLGSYSYREGESFFAIFPFIYPLLENIFLTWFYKKMAIPF